MKMQNAEPDKAVEELGRLENTVSIFWLCPVCNCRFAHVGWALKHCPACGAGVTRVSVARITEREESGPGVTSA